MGRETSSYNLSYIIYNHTTQSQRIDPTQSECTFAILNHCQEWKRRGLSLPSGSIEKDKTDRYESHSRTHARTPALPPLPRTHPRFQHRLSVLYLATPLSASFSTISNLLFTLRSKFWSSVFPYSYC